MTVVVTMLLVAPGAAAESATAASVEMAQEAGGASVGLWVWIGVGVAALVSGFTATRRRPNPLVAAVADGRGAQS